MRVSDATLDFSKALIEQLKLREDFYFVGFCPHSRSLARSLGVKRVLNPYHFHRWPTLSHGLIWWHDWHAFLGEKWRECRFLLMAGHCQHIFHQSFTFKGEEVFMRKAFGFYLGDFIYKEKLPRLSLVNHPYKVVERFEGESRRGHLLSNPRKWPIKGGRELFIPFCLQDRSEIYALAGRNRILLGTCQTPKDWSFNEKLKLWSLWWLWDQFFTWNLSGRVQRDLLKWWSENQSRRYSYPQSALSRAARHWYASFKKWAFSFGSLLWRSRWRKEAQGLDFGAGLYDEGRALSHQGHQRAA